MRSETLGCAKMKDLMTKTNVVGILTLHYTRFNENISDPVIYTCCKRFIGMLSHIV